jgi:hypothetical protein
MFIYPRPRQIEELEKYLQAHRATQSPLELRRAVPIAVVDDQPFAPTANLQANGFQLQYFNDITTFFFGTSSTIFQLLCVISGELRDTSVRMRKALT